MVVNLEKESASARKRRLLTPEKAICLVAKEYLELLKLKNPNALQKNRMAYILEKALLIPSLNNAINALEVEYFVQNSSLIFRF